VLPRISEVALSGCGIIPKTFLFALQIPAIFLVAAFGFALAFIFPFSSQ
jgi:hypothetical protein